MPFHIVLATRDEQLVQAMRKAGVQMEFAPKLGKRYESKRRFYTLEAALQEHNRLMALDPKLYAPIRIEYK